MRSNQKCENSKFVEAWQKAGSVADVCRVTGHLARSAMFKAWDLRRRGVPMKKFVKKPDTESIAALVALAKKHAPK